MHLQPDEVLAGFRTRMADHPDLLVADDDAVVARFEGTAGPLPYRTVEVVRFSTDEITFEHLRGPFIHCEEAFQLETSEHGTAVTHVGTFTMRGGLVGWIAGRLWIRRLFEQHVAAELTRMATAKRPES